MRKNLIKFAKRSMALSLAAIMTLSTASAAFAAEVDESIAPAVEAEAAESGVADESFEAAIDAEVAAVDEQASEEAAITEETVIVPEAEESGEEVTAEEETSGEGFEAGEYSEQIDSGAEVVDESAAEVTEEMAIDETEVTTESEKETEADEEAEEPALEETEPTEAEDETAVEEEVVEELVDMDGTVITDMDGELLARRSAMAATLVGSGESTMQVVISHNGPVSYSGTGTRKYVFNGEAEHGWCVEPQLNGDDYAIKTATEVTDTSLNGYGQLLRMMAYLMPNAPGYSQNPIKAQFDALSETERYIAAHLIMSHVYEDYATSAGIARSSWKSGMNSTFGQYARYYAYGNDYYNSMKAYAQGKSASAGFHLWIIPGTSTQTYLFWTYEPTGYLKLCKYVKPLSDWAGSAMADATQLMFIGGKYSPYGTEYTVYKDSACTQVAAVLTVGARDDYTSAYANGYYTAFTNVVELPVATYYIKETYCANENLTKDPKVYTVKVTDGSTQEEPIVQDVEEYMQPAWLKIVKQSADPDYHASLEGATFKIYKWYTEDTDTFSGYIGYVKTGSNGATNNITVPILECLWAEEVEAPAGYEPIKGPIKITGLGVGWENRKILTLDEPVPSGSLQVIKQPEESAKEIVTGNDCYSLEGAIFEVYSDEDCTELVEGGTLTTDAEGKTGILSGLDIGDYYIIETQASPGFRKPLKSFTKTTPYKVSITAETIESTKPVEAKCYEPPKNDPISIIINKVDAEGEEITSLAGAKFAINYYNGEYAEDTLPAEPMWKWVVQTIDVDGAFQAGLRTEHNKEKSFIEEESDPLYMVGGRATIPYGTVTVTELEAPSGYVAEEGKLLGIYVIDEEFNKMGGVTVSADGVATLDTKIEEKRARYGVSFTKVDDAGTKLANVPFLVKNKATGEQHIMLTDANGVLSTESNKHSANTNANDKAYAGGVIDESKLDASAGVWFSGAKETDLTYLDDARGALPYGDYTFTELRSSANEGMSLVVPFTVKIDGTKEDGEVIDLGTKIDKNKNIITAVTSDRTGTQIALAENNAAFADRVTLSGYKGESIVTTKIFDIAANQQLAFADGKTEIVTTVTANGKETTVDVPFRFDASALAGKTVAVVTTVANAGETATHNADFTDEAEKIYFPLVSTRATVDGGKEAEAGGSKTIVDTVTYAGFPDGTSVKAVAEAVKKGATAADDTIITSAAKTVTVKANGTLKTNVTFDTTDLAGETVYINEKIYVTIEGRDVLVAQENGRTKEAQAVRFIGIGTTLTDKETRTHVALGTTVVNLQDVIAYKGLNEGESYDIFTLLMNEEGYALRTDGTASSVLAKDAVTPDKTLKTKEEREAAIQKVITDNSLIYVKTTKVAETKDGEFIIDITFNGVPLLGEKVVASESLHQDGKIVAMHSDPKDEGQIVTIPKLLTKATDADGETKEIAAINGEIILDTVSYKAMPKDTEVITEAEVFVKGKTEAEDKSIAKVRGTQVVSGDGTYTVKIPIDAADYAGATLYVTERNYIVTENGEKPISEHVDREDTNQTVTIPEISTTLTDDETKDHFSYADTSATLTDQIDYVGLTKGRTYPDVIILMDQQGYAWKTDGTKSEHKAQDLNTCTDDTLTADEKMDVIEARLKEMNILYARDSFVAEDTNGTAYISITYDASQFAGEPMVAGETVYSNGKPKAWHFNPNDEGQTVWNGKLVTKAVDAKDGNKQLFAEENAAVKDTVKVTGAVKGLTYNTTAELWAMGATPEEDEFITSVSGAFTAAGKDAEYEITLTFDGTKYEGRKLYINEKATVNNAETGETRTAADENGRDNPDQTVYVPNIETELVDEKTHTHVTLVEESVTNIDTIHYTALMEGKTYPVLGILMNDEGYAWKTDGTAYTDKKAEELNKYEGSLTDIIAPKTPEQKFKAVCDNLDKLGIIYAASEFTAEAEEGYAEVTFTYNAYVLKGQKGVAGETVYENGEVLATHFDPEDKGQTMYFPELKTTAVDKKDYTKLVSSLDGENAVIRDTIEYKAVAPDSELPIVDVIGNAWAETVTSAVLKGATPEEDKVLNTETTVMTFEDEEGSFTVDIPFDATGLEGREVYISERIDLYIESPMHPGDDPDLGPAIICLPIAIEEGRDNPDQTVKIPEIGTTLTDSETQTHISLADTEVTNNDEVAYKNLTPGQSYPIVTIYMDELGNVYRKDGSVIKTTSTSSIARKIVDTVEEAEAFIASYGEDAKGRYSETADGKYEAEVTSGIIKHDKDVMYYYNIGTHEEVVAALEADNVLYAVSEFTPDTENGSTTVTVKYNGLPFMGKKVVAAEGVFEEGKVLVVHIVPEDEGQTVYLPKIVTKAANGKTGLKHLLAEADAVITDAYTWEEMLPGTEVLVESKAYVKGETEADDVLIAEVSKTLTIEDRNGSDSIDIAVDLSDKGGATIYITETISVKNENGEYVVVSEETSRDIEDQTVYVPKIGTTLVDSETQTHISYGDETVTNVDTIAYEKMPVGEHEVITVYMDDNGYAYKKDGTTYADALAETLTTCKDESLTKAEDKLNAVEANLKALDILYARTTVTLTEETGSVDVTVSYNGVPFLGKKVVAGETMYDESGSPVAMHFMPKDEGQTVYVPKIITTAVDGRDGDKKVLAANEATIKDTLVYEMYPEGTEITTVLELYDVATGKPLVIDGKPVTKTETFKVGEKGQHEISVTFHATSLGGKKVGVVETNYMKVDGKDVIVSKDTYESNKDQVVEMVKSTTTTYKKTYTTRRSIPRTGDTYIVLIGAAVLLLGVALLLVYKRRNKTSR